MIKLTGRVPCRVPCGGLGAKKPKEAGGKIGLLGTFPGIMESGWHGLLEDPFPQQTKAEKGHFYDDFRECRWFHRLLGWRPLRCLYLLE